MKTLIAFALLISTFSCGGDSNDAPEKCNALVSRICSRAIACTNDGTTQAVCVAAAMTELKCADADAVSATYTTCMSDLQTISCEALIVNDAVALPANCKATILFKQ